MKKILITALVTIFASATFAQNATPKMEDKKMEKKMDDKKMMEDKKMAEDKKMRHKRKHKKVMSEAKM